MGKEDIGQNGLAEISREVLLNAVEDFLKPGAPGRPIDVLKGLGVEKDDATGVAILVQSILENVQTDSLGALERRMSFLTDMVSEGCNYFRRKDMSAIRIAIVRRLSAHPGPDSWAFGRLFEISLAEYPFKVMLEFGEMKIGEERMAYMREKLMA